MAELLEKFEPDVEAITLIPSSGGCFEVKVNGQLLYSKLATHRHPEPGEAAGLVGDYMKEVK